MRKAIMILMMIVIVGMQMAKAAEGFESVLNNAILIAESADGSGSGFIARHGGKVWLYTNEHVIRMGLPIKFTNIKGKKLELTGKHKIQIAHNRDLARIELSGDMLAFEWTDRELSIGEDICAYGNSVGSHVITELKGQILGLSNDRIEISAEIVGGNSGGPIVDKDGKVICVSTYGTYDKEAKSDDYIKGTRFAQVRRFGFTCNGVQWATVSFGEYLQQIKSLEDMTELFRWVCKKEADCTTLKSDESAQFLRSKFLHNRIKILIKSIIALEDETGYEFNKYLDLKDKQRYERGRIDCPSEWKISQQKKRVDEQWDKRMGTLKSLFKEIYHLSANTKWVTDNLKLQAKELAEHSKEVGMEIGKKRQ